MTDSRFQRWSRKKTEARNEVENSPAAVVESELSPEEEALAINEALPEQEVLEKYGLPDPNAIELGTDITGFMRKEIPEFMRRKALRSLWKSNPVLAVLDGLNDYDEDYTNAATDAPGVKTIYKVGQGLFDKAKKKMEAQIESPVATSLDEAKENQPAERVSEEETPLPVDTLTDQSDVGEILEPVLAAEKVEADRESLLVSNESQEQTEPRYRPRMNFK